MTKAGEAILAIFKKSGKFTIAGNREYWEELYYENGKIIYAGGETHGNTEDFREHISDEDALRKIKSRLQSHAHVFEKGVELESDEDVLEYWRRWPHEG